MRTLVLRVGELHYAVGLESVREVIEAPTIVRVPTRSRHMRGVFNLRGELIAALDTGALLGVAPAAAPAPACRWWVVLRGAGEGSALAAEDCPRRVELGEPAGRGDTPAVAGRYLDDADQAIALLDLERLLGARIAAGAAAA